MTDFEVLGTVAIGKARPLTLAIRGSGSKNSRKKRRENRKKFLSLFERTGTGIGKEVEMSWKKSLKKVKIHKKAIYAKIFSFTKKSLMA